MIAKLFLGGAITAAAINTATPAAADPGNPFNYLCMDSPRSKSAQANVDRLKQLVSFEKVYAPFDGVVTARKTDIGQLIDSGACGGPRWSPAFIGIPVLTRAVNSEKCRLIVARFWVERAWPALQPRPVQALTALSPMALPAIALVRKSR